MSQYDRVEVMDFLINVLKDHEKSLDTLISRAEDVIVENQSRLESKQPGSPESPPHKIILKDWLEFKKRLNDVDLVCFDLVNSVFVVSASVGLKIYEYREAIPADAAVRHLGKGPSPTYQLSIGLDLFSKDVCEDEIEGGLARLYEIEPQYTRGWLSKELSIHQDYIVCGDIEI
jgi:hypothetical protein